MGLNQFAVGLTLAVLVVSNTVTGFKAYRWGKAACEARVQKQIDRLEADLTETTDRARAAAEDLRREREELTDAQRRLEELAAQGADAGNICLSADRVRRLDAVGSSPRPTARQ